MIKFLFTLQSPSSESTADLYTIPKVERGARWYEEPERTVHIGGIAVPLSFIYLGTGLKTHVGDTEPSLIDPTLPVGKLKPYYVSSAYLKSYQHLSPEERAGYLTWLSNGRKRRDIPLSWVLLFFSGLERRAIYDGMVDKSVQPSYLAIVEEIRRLLLLYGDDLNFNRSATNLLAYIELIVAGPSFEGEGLSLPVSHLFKAKLSVAAQAGTPISAETAYLWVSKLVRHSPVYFAGENLTQKGFLSKYNALPFKEKIPTWSKHQPHLVLGYISLNTGLRGILFSRNPQRMRDVFEAGEFQAKLKKLLQETNKDLQGFNKEKLSRVKALQSLPLAYWPDTLLNLVQELQAESGFRELTWMSALTLFTLPPFSNEISAFGKLLDSLKISWFSEGKELQDTLYLGKAVASETREVSLYGLALYALKLMLGRELTSEEYAQIVSEWTLSPFERLLLQDKLKKWNYKTIAPLLKQIEVTSQQQSRIAEFLATAHQLTEEVPLKTVEKFTKAFGWTSSQTLAAHYGSRVPLHFSHVHTISAESIDAIKAETHVVQQMLGDIFKEEEEVSVKPVSCDSLGLNETESQVLQDILQNNWTIPPEFDTRGLMIGAFVDKVNEACMDKFGDILWEDSDFSCVNPDVASAIGELYD